MGRTSQAITALLKLSPNLAWRVREDGSEEQVPLESVTVGDRLRVKPGEKVPVDGVVLEGESRMDDRGANRPLIGRRARAPPQPAHSVAFVPALRFVQRRTAGCPANTPSGQALPPPALSGVAGTRVVRRVGRSRMEVV